MGETFRLPDVGEGLDEAEIVRWLVAPGDTVAVNQTVVEIETAKSVVELPSPFAGTVETLHAAEGEIVQLGGPLLTVAAADAADAAAAADATDATAAAGDWHADAPRSAGAAAAATVPSPDARAAADDADERPVANLVGYGASPAPRSRRAHRRHGHSASQHTQTDARTASARGTGRPTRAHDDRRPPAIARPPIRRLARDLGVALADVHGTGRGGEVTREDVLAHARQVSVFRNIETPDWPAEREQVVPVRHASGSGAADVADAASDVAGAAGAVPGVSNTAGAASGAGSDAGPSAVAPDVSRGAGAGPDGAAGPDALRDEIVRVHGVRRSIARAMVSSAFTAPHVTVFVDVDATRTMEVVQRLKHSPSFADVKVSPLLVMAKAVIWAAQRNPQANSSFDDERITIHHYVNLGIAAATPRGLLVPNIKDAQRLSLRELARALGDLTATARAGRTPPEDMQHGTITISNIGVFGVDAGTPILNPGEVAIVAMGAIRQKPWVVDGEVRPRYVTTVSASFDHRCVDGDVASRFTADVASVLEEPALLLDV